MALRTMFVLRNLIASLLIILSLVQFEACQKGSNDTNKQKDSSALYGTLVYGVGPYGSGVGRLYALNLDSGIVSWSAAAFIYDNNAMLYDSGTIYTCGLYGATAVESKSGKVKWTRNIASLNFSQSNTIHANHPVLKDSFLYFISFYTNDPHVGLNCLNKNTGAVVWRKNLTQGIYPGWAYSTPAVVGDKVIALTHNSGGGLNRVHCLNRFTGEEIWRDDSTPGEVWDNPLVLDSNSVLFGSRESVLWKVSVNERTVSPFSFVGSVGRLSNNMNFLLKDKKLYVGTEKGIVVLNPNTGDPVATLRDTIESYHIASNSIYIQKTLGYIQGNDLNTFAKKWSWKSPLRTYADTAQTDLLVNATHSFLVSDDKIVCYNESYINRPKVEINSFYLLEAATGKVIKEIKLPTMPPQFPGNNLMLLRNEKVYYSLSNSIR